jgi:AraC-like DNA-binding protein
MVNFTADPSVIESPDGPVLIAATGSQTTERVAMPHRHTRGELMGSMRSLLSVGLERGIWVVPAIHAVWLPPGCQHSARSHGPYEGWAIYVSEDACAGMPTQPCTIRTSSLLHELVLRAAQWPVGPLDPQRSRIASVILDEIRTLPVEPFGLPLPRDPRLQRIAQALISDPAEPRSLDDWADWAAISSRTLSRRFVTETGYTFLEWRQRARLMRSLEMLAGGTPVTTIAMDLGYCTPSAFINLFRRCFGETPAMYRRRLSGPLDASALLL